MIFNVIKVRLGTTQARQRSAQRKIELKLGSATLLSEEKRTRARAEEEVTAVGEITRGGGIGL